MTSLRSMLARSIVPGGTLGLLLTIVVASGGAFAQQALAPADAAMTAEQIMGRVAANQDRAEADRAHYVYVQHARVTSRKGRTVMCEEITDSRVTPTGTGSDVKLLKLDGRYLQKHGYVSYTSLPASSIDGRRMAEQNQDGVSIDIGDDDRELVESLRGTLTNNKADGAKDGINARLFPLTSKAQAAYVFHLLGRERMNGRDVFHIDFRPKDKNDFDWKGDAYIDAGAYEPVVVTTGMSKKVPLAVRTLLGTNAPGLGFSVNYAPQPEGVWFPVSFGTEFKIHVLFFFSREVAVAVQNRDFEKTHVTARVVDGGDPAGPR